MHVGTSYIFTATPAKGYLFSDWTDAAGDVLSSDATYKYVDTDGTLTANFGVNPFYNTPLAGTFTGLYYDTNNGPEVRNAGYLTITITATGAFSGHLYNADYSPTAFPLSGQMAVSVDGSFATATSSFIKLNTHVYVQAILNVATDPVLTDPGAGLLTGFVNAYSSPTDTNAPYSAEIQGKLSSYNTNTVTGLYNIIVTPATNDPSQGPARFSYGSATVSNKKGTVGDVTIVLNLADGTSPVISFSSALAQDGTCPVYAPLYGGNGIFFGWLQFATNGSGAMSPATVTWLTAFDYTSPTWPNGFNAQPALSGGLYVAPKAGTNVFGATNLTFAVDGGFASLALPDETDFGVTYNHAKNAFFDTNKVTITFTPSTGALTGTFYATGAKTSTTFHGVVSGGSGYGFYTGSKKGNRTDLAGHSLGCSAVTQNRPELFAFRLLAHCAARHTRAWPKDFL